MNTTLLVRAAWFALLLLGASSAAQAQPSLSPPAMIALLRQTGIDSYIQDELARELGIPLRAPEARIPVRGKALAHGKNTNTVMVPSDSSRDFLIFIDENESGTTVFLSGTVAGKVQKGLMMTGNDSKLRPVPPMILEKLFKQQMEFWLLNLRP